MTDDKFYAIMDSLRQIDDVLTGRHILTSYTYAARQEIGDGQYLQAREPLYQLRDELSDALKHTCDALDALQDSENEKEETE